MALNLPLRKILAEPSVPRGRSVIVYKDGNSIYAKSENGGIICQNSPTACLQEAVDYLAQLGGGRILIKKGSYQVPQVVINNAKDIMLEFEEGAVLNVTDTSDLKTYSAIGATSMPVVGIVNSENVHIKGGTIIDTGALRGIGIHRDGVLVKNSKYINIEGVSVKNTAGVAIRINGEGTYDFTNPDNSNLLTKHVTIRNCNIENTQTHRSDSTYYVKGFGVEIEFSEDVYVERCAAYNNNESSFRTHAARRVLFIGNYVYNQILGEPFDIWGSDNVVVAFNKIKGRPNANATGIYLYQHTRNIYIIGNDIETDPNGVSIRLKDITGNAIENIWLMFNRISGYVGLENSIMRNIYIIGNDIAKQLYVNPANKININNVVIEGNLFRDTSLDNIYVRNADFVVIRRNYLQSKSIVKYTNKVIIDNNTVYCPSDNIYRTGFTVEGSVDYALIINNYIYNPTYQAILITSTNNGIVDIIGNVFESGASACPTCAVVTAGSDSASMVRVLRNIFRNTLGNRSISIGTGVTAEIFDNVVDKPITVAGVATIKRNSGYATENSGTATIPAGSTRTTVNHELVCTPTKVLITPLSPPPGKLWVENITTTSFDIVTDTSPTNNLRIAWYAEC